MDEHHDFVMSPQEMEGALLLVGVLIHTPQRQQQQQQRVLELGARIPPQQDAAMQPLHEQPPLSHVPLPQQQHGGSRTWEAPRPSHVQQAPQPPGVPQLQPLPLPQQQMQQQQQGPMHHRMLPMPPHVLLQQQLWSQAAEQQAAMQLQGGPMQHQLRAPWQQGPFQRPPPHPQPLQGQQPGQLHLQQRQGPVPLHGQVLPFADAQRRHSDPLQQHQHQQQGLFMPPHAPQQPPPQDHRLRFLPPQPQPQRPPQPHQQQWTQEPGQPSGGQRAGVLDLADPQGFGWQGQR